MDMIVKTDGTTMGVAPKNGSDYSLPELNKFVGGYIEIVRLPTRTKRILVVNEEGAINGMPLNPQATAMAGQPIYGDVLVCGTNRVK